MHKSIFMAAMVLSAASFDPAIAKKTVHHRHLSHAQALTAHPGAPYGQSTGYRYDWQAGDCDITNKTSLNTCSNGGL
jgi:hypothetical protein